MDKEQNTPQNNGNSESDDKQAKTVREPRCNTISFRVSRTQREHIGRLTDKCSMTLSDYVLARSYNYLPKSRLTSEQEAVRNELITIRSDYSRYTSMLNGMSQNERRAMFRNQPWMIGALQLLGRMAEAITRIIDRCFAPNRVPENPELIYHVKDNLLPCRLDAQGVWDMMKARAPKGKNVIRIEVSPAKEHTENCTMKDWEQLWDDFVREYDSMEFKDKHGKVYSRKTNLAGSIYSVWLHLESDSGIPHLHTVVCRKDNEGRTNNDHNIHLRTQYAAERVARQRGWTTAMDIHRMNADEVAAALTDIPILMQSL